MLASAGQALFTAVPQYARGDTAGALKGFLTAGISAFKEKRADDLLKAENTLSADIITLSGCKDDQTVSSGELPELCRDHRLILVPSRPTRKKKARRPAPCRTRSSRPSPRTHRSIIVTSWLRFATR